MSTPTPTGTATFPQFTNLALGDGLFDQLIAAVKVHVREEYTQQRITGADYSRVYLGAMEAVLTNSAQYLLGIMLLEEQRAKIAAEIKLIDLEGEKLRFQIDYMYPMELAKLELERDNLTLQNEKLRFEIDYLYPAQLIKLQQEGLLIEAQVRLADANVDKTIAETAKIEAETVFLETQKLQILAQIAKINQEILFLDWKIKTEKANTVEDFAAGSVIGRQTALLKAQQLGFAGDLHLKVSKLHADYAAVYESVNELGVVTLPPAASGSSATAIAGQIGFIA